ncbi:hypothetical protein AB0N88_04795 [Streptomyces sp. NPDC093516]
MSRPVGRGAVVACPHRNRSSSRDLVDLSPAMQDLYEKAGSPPLRT